MRSLAATANPVASASSDVRSACTTSTSGIAATGLKKCSPTTRSGCCRSAAIAVTDSAEVFVARIVVGEMTVSSSANTFFFRSRISVTASMTRSQDANSARSVVPWIEPSSRRAADSLIRPVDVRRSTDDRTAARPLSTRSWSRSRMTTGTPRRCANSIAICAAMSPAPTMPTRVTGCASDRSGAPTGFLPPETSPNAYTDARISSLMIRSASASSSAAKASSRDAVARGGDQVERAVRRRPRAG